MIKKISLGLLALLFALSLAAANTTSSSKGFLVDQGSGWWRAETKGFARHVITIDYVKGDGTSITITAGCRFTAEICLVGTTTYYTPLIDMSGNLTTDPITVTLPSGVTSRSFYLIVEVPENADYVYALFEYTGGTTATVNANIAPIVPR